MTARLFAGITWIGFVLGLALRPAWADSLSSPEDRSPAEKPEKNPRVDPGPPPGDINPGWFVSTPPVPPPPLPIPARSAEPSLSTLWPLEYVLRPQTLPKGRVELGGGARAFRPQSGRLTAADGSPYIFNSYLSLGFSARAGLTERLELGFFAPRVLCLSQSEPSGCNDINRYNGTGPSLAYGVVRTGVLQIELLGSIAIARSAEPLTWAWDVGAYAKILVGRMLAVEVALAFSRLIDPGLSADRAIRILSPFTLNLQATRQLNIFAGLSPHAPVDHMGAAELKVWGGASFTFLNLSEMVASAGTYNVLGQRSWDDSVPGTFYTLSMLFRF